MLTTFLLDIICIILSQLMFAILMSGILILIGLINKNKKGILLRVIPIIVVALVLWFEREQILSWLYDLIHGSKFSVLSLRVKNIYDLLVNKDTSGDAGARFELYKLSLTSFLHYPLGRFLCGTKGVLDEIGFHSEFCDLIGTLGVFGVIIIILTVSVFWRKIKCISNIFDKRYYISMVGVFLIMFIINPIIPYPQIWLTSLVVPLVAIEQMRTNII